MFDEETIQSFPGLVCGAGCQQPGECLKFLLELTLVSSIESLTGLDAHTEDIDDFAGRRPRWLAAKRIDVPCVYVQPERRKYAAEDGKLRKVVKTDDEDVELVCATPCDAAPHGVCEVKFARHANVGGDFFGRECGEVIVIHPNEEILNDLPINFGTKRLNGLFRLGADHHLSLVGDGGVCPRILALRNSGTDASVPMYPWASYQEQTSEIWRKRMVRKLIGAALLAILLSLGAVAQDAKTVIGNTSKAMGAETA